jgi:hypothetical protein
VHKIEWGRPMTIHRMLLNTPLGPEDIQRVVTAYEHCLRDLGLKERDDPLTQLVAKKAIEAWQAGVHDPIRISELVITGLRLP